MPEPSFLEVHHLIIIIGALLLALIVVGSGRGIGVLVKPLIKRWTGNKETAVTVNIEGGDMAGKAKENPCAACSMMVDPGKCPLHEMEKAGRIRNEKEIEKLWANYDKLSEEMRAGFADLQKRIEESQRAILGALSTGRRAK